MTLGPFLRAPNRLLPNLPANTDPQQQEAASPRVLVVRLPLR
jgi:hypothetical protein